MIVIGWDVSTTMIGVCAIDSSDDRTIGYWALPIDGESMVEKYSSAIAGVDDIMSKLPGDRRHFVEDRLGNFSAGLTTLQTLMKLAQMNAVVSFHLSCDAQVTHLHPATSKRIAGLKVPKGGDKKAEAIRLATSVGGLVVSLTRKGNPIRGTEDMADAYLLAISGARLVTGRAALDETRKADGAAKQAGRRGKTRQD